MGEWNWVSFFVGALFIPGALVVGAVVHDVITRILGQREHKRYLASTCADCYQNRGIHSSEGYCPKPPEYSQERFKPRDVALSKKMV